MNESKTTNYNCLSNWGEREIVLLSKPASPGTLLQYVVGVHSASLLSLTFFFASQLRSSVSVKEEAFA